MFAISYRDERRVSWIRVSKRVHRLRLQIPFLLFHRVDLYLDVWEHLIV